MLNSKKVDLYKMLLLELNTFAEDKFKYEYSDNVAPELVAALSGIGTGMLGIGAVYSVFAGMSGAQIMSTLAGFGVGGSVGGIVSIAALVSAPVLLVGSAAYAFTKNRKFKNEVKQLRDISIDLKQKMKEDDRGRVKELLVAINDLEIELFKK
ncbi:hypothetical protein [Streptococcus uberis]|uniref:hypothetical protein n=1 Tax=Streptococcus uberis TaxID=1349 RepID=UPI0012B577D5|nr:hypothetical protein [Streptococcus uberis]MTB58877.1 hypothetical protein [Streptococcus uberis]MTC00168.1 hypothetical protein [Streptococcus uberis]